MSIELKPCPFCGTNPEARWSQMNPKARCGTEGCKGAQLPVTRLDDPEDIAAWNTRATLAQVQGELCPTCGETEPYTGSCGTSNNDTKALCKQPAQATQTEVTDSMIREAFLANGFTIKDGHSDLKPYVYAAARAILALRPEKEPMTGDERGEAYLKHTKSYEGYRSTFMRGVWAAEAHHGIAAKAKKEDE